MNKPEQKSSNNDASNNQSQQSNNKNDDSHQTKINNENTNKNTDANIDDSSNGHIDDNNNNSNTQINGNDVVVSNQHSEIASSFPPALRQAYKLMQANKKKEESNMNEKNENENKNENDNDNNEEDIASKTKNPHRLIKDKDTGLVYDIDNLPIHTTETPMLSLQKLKSATSQKNKNNKQNDHHKKDSHKGKYSKFFVKNFFLKKHDEEQKNANDDDNDDNDEQKRNLNINRIKIKGNTKEKEMNDLRLAQKIENAHKGAIYCMEFSKKGDYLATGGQDSVLRIWTVCGSRADLKRWDKDKSQQTNNDNNNDQSQSEQSKNSKQEDITNEGEDDNEHEYNFNDIISIVAYREFTGHRADIIDISWSNGEFILSASIDQTVMLWHTSRSRCLCLFQHSDIVTSVQFHPNEDYLFLSGSFDSRLRLWNILEHRVVDWVQVPTLVTCTTFSINGKFAIAGLYDGQCFFYSTQGHRLKYVTAIECRNSSGKYRKGRKVTGLQYLPQINKDQHVNIGVGDGHGHIINDKHKKMEHGSPQLLITTNDSRLRLYNLSNFDMKCKYKGHENTQSQIHARFSPDGKLIICGSEDNNIYIWKVEKSFNDESNSLFQSKKSKNRQEYYEYFKSNCKLPQVALFAPHRTIHYIYKYMTMINKKYTKDFYKNNQEKIKHIILTADTEGHINIYTNHSNQKNYRYPYTHHHHHNHQYHHNNHHRNSNKKSTKKKYK